MPPPTSIAPLLLLLLAAPGDGLRVVGYLPDYRVRSIDPDAPCDVTDLVYFSADADPSGAIDRSRLGPEVLEALRSIKARHPGMRRTLSVGGWGRSKGFARLAASAESRSAFARNAAEFCRAEGFDGIDLDWEHPEGPAQVRDHGRLVSAIREAFAPAKLELTMAVADWQELAPETIAAVDRVHLMSYDHEGRHSTVEQAESDIRRVIARGVPPSKIVLGVPFYGRTLDRDHREVTYSTILGRHRPAPGVDEAGGAYFNGPATIARKVAIARAAGLGGVMIWELGQDAPGDRSLLKALREAAAGP